jgi:hypothetical protein
MSIEGLIAWMAEGPFWVFAMLIGIVVSFDVMVVELTRDYKLEKRDGRVLLWNRRMRIMTFLHASFHALSFLIYTTIIYLLQSFIFFPIELFELPQDLTIGLLALINFFVLAFIWWTYRSKIKEDHSDKLDDSSTIEREDMKIFVNLVRALAHKWKLGDLACGVAVAGSVAVDMLAVSALLKNVLLPNGAVAPIATATGFVLIDIIIFAMIIFVTVGVCVVFAQLLGRAAREWNFAIIFFRIAEPFAVFFLTAGLLRVTTEKSFGVVSQTIINQNAIDAIFAFVIVLSLFWSNGIGVKELLKIYARRSVDAFSNNPHIHYSEIWADLKRLTPALGSAFSFLVIILVALYFAYSTEPGRTSHNHLAEATGYIACAVLFFSVLMIYSPSERLDRWETNANNNFGEMTKATPWQFWNRLGGVALALLTLNFFNFSLIGRTFETEAIVIWSGYVVLSWSLFDVRRWRFSRSDPSGSASRVNDADYAELISAIGIASSAVAIIVQYLVQDLKTI